jgi:hypothetical protein
MNEFPDDEMDDLLSKHTAQLRYEDADPWADQRMERRVLERLREGSVTSVIAGPWGWSVAMGSAACGLIAVTGLQWAQQSLELALFADPEWTLRLLLTGGF